MPCCGKINGMSNTDARQFAIELSRITHDHKSEDVVAFDLRGMSPVTDFAVVCTGRSERQMHALGDHLIEYGRKVGQRPYGVCGKNSAAWLIIDYVDVVIHIFAKPYREYYDLELLWGDAPRLDWSRGETA